MDSSLPAPSARPQPKTSILDVSVIIPARNEEANLGACLHSLTTQVGIEFEIIVVDDASNDRTREIAESFSGVRVISARPLSEDLTGKQSTGKNNALEVGVESARANWFLFTDADTVHLPGSLMRALKEAENEKTDLLSYSPEQIVVTFTERAVMPVIFSELTRQYPPRKVRDPKLQIVAANGQYILVRRAAYEAVGGHAAVRSEILEDVALARLFRNGGFHVHFRYGGDVVRARMYRNWVQLRAGWTKNLALLFPQSTRMAMQSLLFWFLAWTSLALAGSAAWNRHPLGIGFLCFWVVVYRRIRISHFRFVNNLLAIAFGFPIFTYLLLRSNAAHKQGRIRWKGRAYNVGTGEWREAARASKIPIVKGQELRADN